MKLKNLIPLFTLLMISEWKAATYHKLILDWEASQIPDPTYQWEGLGFIPPIEG